MFKTQLEALIDDATLVADTGSRLGAFQDDELGQALAVAHRSLTQDPPDASAADGLRRALNSAMKAIAPITLNDLRNGWRPYVTGNTPKTSTVVFFILAILLMLACAYTTQVYERARAMYATTLELQEARGAEQAMRLFGLLKRNQQDVLESLESGKKEFLYEIFGKALFDLKAMHLKNQSYLPIASGVLNDLEMMASPTVALDRFLNPTNPTGDAALQVLSGQKGYGSTPPESLRAELEKIADLGRRGEADPRDVQVLLENYLSQLRRFNQSIDLTIDPLQPHDYFSNLIRLRNGIGFLGQWILPALYGMLGAIIFHMRRLLNPAAPDSSWMRITFRVLLGAFAGIIIVWFITPSTQKITQGEFITLTSFGLAFLVGFSTDVFFRALDRLVDYMSGAIGGQPAH